MTSNQIKLIKHNLPYLLIFALIFVVFLLVSAPFFHDGFFPMTDDVQVVRLEAMFNELMSHQFPVRYVDSFGNGGGYMFFNFYAPLTYFVGALIHSLGFTLVKSTKLVFILYEMIGTAGIFVLLHRYTDKITATLGTILFLTATYINFNSYFRGALGENFAIMLLPWLVLAIFYLREKFTLIRALFVGLILGIIILTHSFIAVGAAVMVIALIPISKLSRKNIALVLLALFVGLALSAFFWMPSLLEQKYIIYDKTYFAIQSYKGNFLSPLQIFGISKIPWNFKPPFLGIGLSAGVLFSLFVYFKDRKIFKSKEMFVFHLGVFLISLFFAWSISKLIWDHISFVRSFQFPYRFIGFMTFSAVVLIALGLAQIKNNFLKIALGLLFILPAMTLQYNYLRPATYNYISIYTPDDICSSSTWAQEYLPIGVTKCLPKNKKINLVLPSKNIAVSNVNNEFGREISFNTSGKDGNIQVSKYYFPGWKAEVNGNPVNVYANGKYGLITFSVPKGNSSVKVWLDNTKTRLIANIISLSALLLLIVGFIAITIFQINRVKLSSNKKTKK